MLSFRIFNKRQYALSVVLVHLIVIISPHAVNAKPASTKTDVSSSSSTNLSSRASQPAVKDDSPDNRSSGRKVLTSLHEDGTWQASARLPTSTRSGGKGHSSTTTRKTDLTNNGQRTIDIDSTQQQHQQQTKEQRGTPGTGSNFPPVRSQRRLHKWSSDKTDELNEAAEENDGMAENEPLVQSLSAMASHLMDSDRKNSKHDSDDDDDEEDDETENLENSSERDVYLTDKGHGATTPIDDGEGDTEETASEEDSTDQADTLGGKHERKHGNGDLNDVGGEDDDNEEEAKTREKMSPKLKSDHYATTPKGLTTWSAVNGPSQMPMYSSKVTVQKIPLEYTISSVLSFSTERPQTTQEMVVIKERETTTEPSTNKITTKVNLLSPSAAAAMKNKRRPYNKNNKKVAPSKFVKPQLEEVTAEVASIDDTHVVYKTKVTTEGPEPKFTGVTDYYDRFTTKKPLWPYQITTRRVLPTKRPAFSRITTKPKNPYQHKKPQLLTTPTTTTPASTTTYMRNPQTAIITPISGLSLSLTDMPFMDFLRSQIIPRIGLTLISFMASTPLLLTFLGAAGLRRRKRSLTSSSAEFSSFNGRALFESLPPRAQTDQFDFSTVQKKLEDAMMKQPTRRRVVGGNGSGVGSPYTSFDIITEAFRQLTRWWAAKSTSSKTRSVNNSIESKQQKRDI